MLDNGRETLELDWYRPYSLSCFSLKSVENDAMLVQVRVKWS